MIRFVLVLLGIILLIALSIGLLGEPGTASLNWMAYRVDTTATAGVVLIGVMTFVAVAFWNFVVWLARSPRRAERKRLEQRRLQGEETITQGFVAIANGDPAEARRHAVKAAELSDNASLVLVLAALAARESADTQASRAAYTAMLEKPELRQAGLKGLSELALAQGDKAEAVRLAQDAYNQTRPSLWALHTLLQARLEAAEWTQAQELIEGALGRKRITPAYADRARAALMAANAARLEAESAGAEPALETALRAVKLAPAFTPAALTAARLLNANGKTGRAEDVLEAAWAARPHPAIVLAYRDLMPTETPQERANRFQELINRNPDHRETRLLRLERATLLGVEANIHAAMNALEEDLCEEGLTRRACGVMARAAIALKDMDTAAKWITKGQTARPDPNWSDIQADGTAFPYVVSDWATLVQAFTETGELAHPRLRNEYVTDRTQGMAELPELPKAYVPSMPFVKAAGRASPVRTNPAPQPDAADTFGDAIAGRDIDEAPAPAPRSPRRKKTVKPN